jgi:hypothetical protein
LPPAPIYIQGHISSYDIRSSTWESQSSRETFDISDLNCFWCHRRVLVLVTAIDCYGYPKQKQQDSRRPGLIINH